MSQSVANRVFLFGAGVSAFAGFPLGKTLWPFLLDHCGLNSTATESIDAYLSMVPEPAREKVTSDLELLLSELERGGWRRAERLIGFEGDEGSNSSSPVQAPEGKDSFFKPQRHLLANLKSKSKDWARIRLGAKPQDFLDDYYEGRLIRRSGIARAWYPISMRDFIEDVRCGFLDHHACILYGRKHYAGSSDAPPETFSDVTGAHCPCYCEYSLYKNRKTINAIGSYFTKGDTLITFNWDALLESILFRHGKWTLSDGYGIPVQIKEQIMRRWRKYLSKSLHPSSIKVLKAHGSINWARNVEDKSIGVNYLGLLFDLPVYSTYSTYARNTRLFDPDDIPDYPYIEKALLAPTYDKKYTSDGALSLVWDKIVESVKTASEITVIGYSLPPGDQSACELLAYGLRQNKQCTTVSVVNPVSGRETQWPDILEKAGKKVVWLRSTFVEWIQRESQKQRL